jgi:chromosome segregation ATPase
MLPLKTPPVTSPTTWTAELIASDGTRRPLPVPCAVLGSDANCELFFDLPDLAPFHAVFTVTPQGITLRDLQSPVGTRVNRQSISSLLLKDGDLVEIGALSFRLHIAQVQLSAEEVTASLAGRQAALLQEEGRLSDLERNLRKEEKRVAIFTEEKQKKLLSLTERYQAQRRRLKEERLAFEKQIDAIQRDMPPSKREWLAKERQLLAEAKRLRELETALKDRFRRRWQSEHRKIRLAHRKLLEQKKALDARTLELTQMEETLKAKRLRFNADFVLGRQHLRESWSRLKSQQQRWKHRRGRERAVLKVRELDLETFARKLQEAAAAHQAQRAAWTRQQLALRDEIAALERRAGNQQQLLESRQAQLRELDTLLEARRRELERLGQPAPQADAFQSLPAELLVKTAKLAWLDRDASEAAAPRAEPGSAIEPIDQWRVIQELWQRMQKVLFAVQAERQQLFDEMAKIVEDIQLAGSAVRRDLVVYREYEGRLQQEHENLEQRRQHVVGWHARLHQREAAWQAEKHQLLTELRTKEERLQQGIVQLEEMRRSWTERWQRECDELRREQVRAAELVRDWTEKRTQLLERAKMLDNRERRLTERQIAAEAYLLERSIDPGPEASKRLDLLRRRWLLQNANILRTITRDRNALREDLIEIRNQINEWEQRSEAVEEEIKSLDERAYQFDYQVTQNIDRQSRLREEAEAVEAMYAFTSKQLESLRTDFETLAHALLDAPEPPLQLPKAA